ncbi:MAG: DNA polymerase I [Flavobacteriales bacterium]|nr:DNA polymerase I [Flavobacteriales bacterium]
MIPTEPQDKRLFLLDSYALIYRGYYAFSRTVRPNSHGQDTSAVMGFVNTLLDMLRKERPSHIAAVFDTSKPTFRHILYEPYKAQREATPEAITFAVPVIKEILEAFHIPQMAVEGFEADDVVGTLARQAEEQGYTTYMVTPDKDYAQLVTEKTFMYRPSRMGNGIEIWDVERVKERFGVAQPSQVKDYLGMMGDASDNIPGLPGVGEKTAKKYLQEYGTMENLLANAHKIAGAAGKKIVENAEIGILSKRLATIETDVPVTFDHTKCHMDAPDLDAVRAIFERLEFRRMLEAVYRDFAGTQIPVLTEKTQIVTLPQKNASQLDMFSSSEDNPMQTLFSSEEDLSTSPHTYFSVNTDEEIDALIKKLLAEKEITFDTETTSVSTLSAQIVGMSFSVKKTEAYWVPLSSDEKKTRDVLEKFRSVFENENIAKVGQNIKYDMEILSKYGIEVRGELYDTMVAHYLIDPESRHGMDSLASRYLSYRPMTYQQMMSGKKDIRTVDAERIREYAAEDADITLRLKEVFSPLLVEKGAEKLFKELEMPLVPVLAQMETTGVKIDTAALDALGSDFSAQLSQMEQKIFEQVGETFNLNSPRQLGEVLFKKMGIGEKVKKTRTGQISTSEEVLSALAPDYPVVADILEYRSLGKLLSTYVQALPKEINPATGRIHTSFNQTLTATGRLSSSGPNLQNIPIRTPRGTQIRSAFIASSPENVIMAADYSQIELRIIASLAGEDAMIQAFEQGQDIHRSTAARVFGVDIDAVTKEQRSHAKSVNFGIIYGISAHGLTRQTGLSYKEASEVIKSYYATYPRLTDYIERQKEFARENGYVETITGRRRYLPDINSRNATVRGMAERNAVNAPIQGSAADIIKRAMIDIYNVIKEEKLTSRMILQVHDELVFDVPKKEQDVLREIVREKMQGAWVHRVPLIVEIGVGDNWLQAH